MPPVGNKAVLMSRSTVNKISLFLRVYLTFIAMKVNSSQTTSQSSIISHHRNSGRSVDLPSHFCPFLIYVAIHKFIVK